MLRRRITFFLASIFVLKNQIESGLNYLVPKIFRNWIGLRPSVALAVQAEHRIIVPSLINSCCLSILLATALTTEIP